MTCRVVGTRVLTTLTVLNDRAGRNAALCRGYSRGMVLPSTIRSVVLAGARCCAEGRGHNSPAGDWCHTATGIASCAAMVVSARKTVTHPETSGLQRPSGGAQGQLWYPTPVGTVGQVLHARAEVVQRQEDVVAACRRVSCIAPREVHGACCASAVDVRIPCDGLPLLSHAGIHSH